MDMVEAEYLDNENDIREVKNMIENHVKYTGSSYAKRILDNWEDTSAKFVKIIPKDYKRMLQAIKKVQDSGLAGSEALMAAFEANYRDTARVSGN
jgi:glutamate synthase (ferredoxin)